MTGLEALAAAASAVSGIVGAMGAMQAANAQAEAAEYNARIQERNAIIADQNRKAAVTQASIDAEDKRRDNRRVMASIRAAYGHSGIDLIGSPLDVLEDTALEQELDAQRIEYEGRARSREGAIKMLGLHEQAELDRMEARSARSAGRTAAAGALIGGAGRALTRLT